MMFDFLSALEQAESMLTTEQVQAMLQVPTRTMARWIATEEIPSVQIGKKRRFDPRTPYYWYVRKNPMALKARQAVPLSPCP
jgi:excisionase family DNA binding protein